MNKIHFICHFKSMYGGAELECLDLASSLKRRNNKVTIWATRKSPVSNAVLKKHGVFRMRLLHFPIRGTLVICGGWLRPPKRWQIFSRFRRVVIICNTPKANAEKTISRYQTRTRQVPELVFLSESQPGYIKELVSAIHPSPILPEKFAARCQPCEQNKTVIFGRLSRDTAAKHHPEDCQLYRKLAAQSHKVRIMGGCSLSEYDATIGNCEGVSILNVGQESADDFLHSLDVFFYRTSTSWLEPFGRIIPEAMLSSLPVVCENRGGYAALITHGRNGFLFDTTDEALAILLELANDADLRARVGRQARQDMLELYSPENTSKRLEFYEK